MNLCRRNQKSFSSIILGVNSREGPSPLRHLQRTNPSTNNTQTTPLAHKTSTAVCHYNLRTTRQTPFKHIYWTSVIIVQYSIMCSANIFSVARNEPIYAKWVRGVDDATVLVLLMCFIASFAIAVQRKLRFYDHSTIYGISTALHVRF